MDIFRTLGRIKTWHFFIGAVLFSEIFTLILNSIQSISRWGVISRELVEIGTIDAFFVSILVTSVLLPLLRYTTKSDLEKKILEREITERKQIEETLRESEEKYRTLFNSAGDSIFIVDEEGRMLAVNPAACERLAYKHAELMSMTVAQVDSPEEALHTPERMTQLMKHGDLSFETVHKRKDGSLIPTEVSARRITWDGKPAVMSICRDITARRRAEDALRESERKYRELVENANSIILRWNPRGEITFLNEFGQNFFSYRENEILGRNVLGTITPDSESNGRDLRPLMKNICDNPKAFEQNINENILRDGRRVWIAWTNKAVFDAEGNLIEVLSIGTDITERKRSEEILLKNARLLRRAEEVARFGNWEFLLDENKVNASEGARTIYGLGTKEWRMTDIRSIALPEYRPMLNRALKDLIEQGIPYNVEFKIRRPADAKIIDIQSMAEYDSSTRTVFGVIQDITDRIQTEKEAEALQMQLLEAQKMESVGRLAGGVAHDFNNMLSAILGHAELAMMRCNPSDRIYVDLKAIERSALRSAELIRQLLAFARKQTVAPTVLDLNGRVAGMLKMLQRLIGEDIDLVWLPGADLWPVKIDPSQIDQLLANLCVNARDAIPEVGKITIETANITIDEVYCAGHPGFVCGDYVMLAVSDNGFGMSKEVLDHLFEPFFTTKEVGKGTGLGLSTVHGIVKQNEGLINVYSEPGKGSTFKIYLPRFAGGVIEPAPKGATETPRGRGETVLLVEDETMILNVGRGMLESLGYTVLTAGTPGEALRQAEAHSNDIQLLITDVVMPEMNGRELANLIGNIKPELKCIFTSGYTANLIAHRGVLDEGVYFLQKPFSIKDLASKVREVLDLK